jgi:hypothetical protein
MFYDITEIFFIARGDTELQKKIHADRTEHISVFRLTTSALKYTMITAVVVLLN